VVGFSEGTMAVAEYFAFHYERRVAFALVQPPTEIMNAETLTAARHHPGYSPLAEVPRGLGGGHSNNNELGFLITYLLVSQTEFIR